MAAERGRGRDPPSEEGARPMGLASVATCRRSPSIEWLPRAAILDLSLLTCARGMEIDARILLGARARNSDQLKISLFMTHIVAVGM